MPITNENLARDCKGWSVSFFFAFINVIIWVLQFVKNSPKCHKRLLFTLSCTLYILHQVQTYYKNCSFKPSIICRLSSSIFAYRRRTSCRGDISSPLPLSFPPVSPASLPSPQLLNAHINPVTLVLSCPGQRKRYAVCDFYSPSTKGPLE